MSTRETAPAGAPCWIDLYTSDADRARAFYSELFGWVAEAPSPEHGGYFMFTRAGAPVAGGMGAQEGQGTPDMWSTHLAVEDAVKTLELATAHGGSVHMEPMPVTDLGTMARVGDPGGGDTGIWQPNTFQGFSVLGEHGAPGWFELHAANYPATVEFYRSVFGWDTETLSDTPEFRYTTLRGPGGEGYLAGIADDAGPQGEPTRWGVYFCVDDVDEVLAAATALGGSVTMEAEDTPYGRLAAATDPMGAQFRLQAFNDLMPAQ